jgi:phage tail sheath protein FI
VEETSFRSKSIEGVSTSTTGFVGPTRKGPIGGTPELITSFGDFERIYGGLAALSFSTNYLAHAVRAYFNEGGARLYVSRVYIKDGAKNGKAQSRDLVGAGTDDQKAKAFFVARSPGEIGNGVIRLHEVAMPVTRRVIERAPEGTLLRTGGKDPATPARLTGGTPPFSVTPEGVLALLGTPAGEIKFSGTPAEAKADTALGATVTIDDPNKTLTVIVDGVTQEIALTTDLPRADLVTAIDGSLSGATAKLQANKIVISSKRLGKRASVVVRKNTALGFSEDTTAQGGGNVGDLQAVTADDIDALLKAGGKARASVDADGRLVLSTAATGSGADLGVAVATDPAVSIHTILGFTAPTTPLVKGGGKTAVVHYLKSGSNYVDAENKLLNLTNTSIDDEFKDGSEFVTLTAVVEDKDGNTTFYEDMAFDSRHPRWVGNILAEEPKNRADQLGNMFAISIGSNVKPFDLRSTLFPTGDRNKISLSGGSDGLQPVTGDEVTEGTYAYALTKLGKVEDISIVAAPGHSAYAEYQSIQGALIAHAETRRSYRIAVLDTPPAREISEARSERGRIDSKYAAMYYPWVEIANPLARPGNESIPREITVPPSGFVCGIYARNDVERGVYKAPANEVVRSALRFEKNINFAQQEVLNPLGVNCLRFFSGRGFRVWGARTASSDPEWKYVNVRRYFIYLEASIDRGTQWAVFEPNGERLWANVRDTVSAFLYNEWKSGALLGTTQQEAFFVRCDRSTMTQNDLDNGRLICEVGVAALKPAEFVIFRIGQKTADAKS